MCDGCSICSLEGYLVGLAMAVFFTGIIWFWEGIKYWWSILRLKLENEETGIGCVDPQEHTEEEEIE